MLREGTEGKRKREKEARKRSQGFRLKRLCSAREGRCTSSKCILSSSLFRLRSRLPPRAAQGGCERVSVNNECTITKRRRERHEQHRSGVMSDTQGRIGASSRARDYPAAGRNDRGAGWPRRAATLLSSIYRRCIRRRARNIRRARRVCSRDPIDRSSRMRA